jgi:hypothetical protein
MAAYAEIIPNDRLRQRVMKTVPGQSSRSLSLNENPTDKILAT